jgi:hypothetical protein
MICDLPKFPPAELTLRPGERKNLLFEVGSDELRALQFFSRRYFPGQYHNAADPLHHIALVALAHPEIVVKALETDFRYAVAEGIGFLDHIKGKIRAHAEYADCAPLLVTHGHDS